jgi:hypothetical protein
MKYLLLDNEHFSVTAGLLGSHKVTLKSRGLTIKADKLERAKLLDVLDELKRIGGSVEPNNAVFQSIVEQWSEAVFSRNSPMWEAYFLVMKIEDIARGHFEEKSIPKGFKIDMEKADRVMKETTPEQWQESMDQLTAERMAQTRRLMNEITYPPNPPLFIWEDVSNYYMDGGRPAVQVRPSDGSIFGFVLNRKTPRKWRKISPLELIHDSKEISKESFFNVYADLYDLDE